MSIGRDSKTVATRMATIGGVRGRGFATESTGPDGISVLNGRIKIHSDDYPRVADLFTILEPVEYRGPVEKDGQRTTQSRAVILLRVDAPNSSSVSLLFENMVASRKHAPPQ